MDTIGWRWIFLVMLPLGTLALAITSVGLRLPFITRKRPIDWPGAALLVTGSSAALLLVPIWGGEQLRLDVAPGAGRRGAGRGAHRALLWWETKAPEPVLPLRLFRDRTVRAVFAMNFGQMFGLIAVATFLPLFLQVATGASATRSGLRDGAAEPGHLRHRHRCRGSWSAGGVATSGRCWRGRSSPRWAWPSLSTIDRDTTPLGLAPFLVVTGLGLGLSFPNMTIAVQNAVDMADLGVATSTANFFRNMGSTFGAGGDGGAAQQPPGVDADRPGTAERLSEVGGAEGLVRSPKLVRELDPDLHDAVIEAVTSAVTVRAARSVVPIFVLMFGLALFVKEKPLRTTSVLGGAGRAAQPTPAADGPGGGCGTRRRLTGAAARPGFARFRRRDDHDFSLLHLDRADGVLWATIDAPPINVMTTALARELARLSRSVAADDEVRAVVLQSANPEFFIAHFDVGRILVPRPTPPRAQGELNGFHQDVRACGARCPRPPSSRSPAGSAAAGPSCRPAATCASVCSATPSSTRWRYRSVSCPGGTGTQRLPRLLGRGRAMELVLGGVDLDAATAERWGWLNRAFATVEELDAYVDELARRIASFPPQAVINAKAAVLAAEGDALPGLLEEAYLFDQLVPRPDAQAAMHRFLAAGGQTRDGERRVGELNAEINRP